MDSSGCEISRIRNRIIGVIAGIANASPQAVADARHFAELEQWDSLMHLHVILDIEREFSVKFELEEITQIDGLNAAATLVARKLTQS